MATEKQIEDAAARGALRALKAEIGKEGGKRGTTTVRTEAAWNAANVQRIVDGIARCEKLLQAIATAVAPRRIALAVWGYKGNGSPVAEGGTVLDAFATLNGVHRQVHTPAGVIESPVTDPESEVK